MGYRGKDDGEPRSRTATKAVDFLWAWNRRGSSTVRESAMTNDQYDQVFDAYERRMGRQLKGMGHEKHGPCPVCGDGGKGAKSDRFWIRKGESALIIACRTGCTFDELLRALRLTNGNDSPKRTDRVAPGPAARQRNPWLSDVWQAAVKADDTPGGRYLVDRRCVWLEDQPLPSAVRWLPAQRAKKQRVRQSDWPVAAAGCLVYRFAVPGEADTWALTVEAITEDGNACPFVRGGKRPSLAGSYFAHGRRVFRVGGELKHGMHLAEGPLDALALVTLHRLGQSVRPLASAAIFGVDGTSGLTVPACHGVGPVTIWTDGDRPGRVAGHKLRAALQAVTRPCRLVAAPPGRDWANEAADAVAERRGIRDD